MTIRAAHFLGLAALASVATGASAQSNGAGIETSTPASTSGEFARFTPTENPKRTRLDYSIWDEALSYFVFRMGKSIREQPASVSPPFGTRRIYGHDSRYRLEGNRVTFTYMSDDVVDSLSEYRQDLERIATQIDISQLSRNEQLAFWMNLHNVAVIEQIAREYPLSQPSRMKIGSDDAALDVAKFITVSGVAMSPRDIRTKIVYPNWKDPSVIYGFWRGEIGGPSIQPKAFTARNVRNQLDEAGTDFVNSMRGTEKRGRTLHVSTIYEEAAPFYFPDFNTDLRNHLTRYSDATTTRFIEETQDTQASLYEADIADLANGERQPSYSNIVQTDANGDTVSAPTRIPGNIARLLLEHRQKVEKIIKREGRQGRVTFIDIDLPGEDPKSDEVE